MSQNFIEVSWVGELVCNTGARHEILRVGLIYFIGVGLWLVVDCLVIFNRLFTQSYCIGISFVESCLVSATQRLNIRLCFVELSNCDLAKRDCSALTLCLFFDQLNLRFRHILVGHRVIIFSVIS